ncbi:hypothetical protein [Selenomonas sp. FC4001]|uniref:hypothetical protein n=1 Tax=Selenomonas sp. FC4001 TaxID=1408313 RepID=UPI00055A1D9B|nr:hypothetical protein [Selenomonas sp. FC4001]
MKPAKLLALLLTVICISLILTPTMTEARQKSSVLLVFNNQSGRDADERLSEIAHNELGKKINGLYHVIDNRLYEKRYSQKSFFNDTLDSITEYAKESPAKYFVYVELMPFRQAEGFNVIWHRKKMVSNIGLIIIDLQSHKELFKEKYSVEKNDDTDFFFVGSPSMARKSLKGALFIAGEAISIHLPL